MKATSDTSGARPRNCCEQCAKDGFSPVKSKKMESRVAPRAQISSHNISYIAFPTTTRWVIEHSGIGSTKLFLRRLTAQQRLYCFCRHTRRCFSWARNGVAHHRSIILPTTSHNSGTTSPKGEGKSSSNSLRLMIPKAGRRFLTPKRKRRFTDQN